MSSRNAILNAMRKEQQMARQRVTVARKKSIPLPVGGWDTRDASERIPPTYAERFTNVISSRDGVRPRLNPVAYASISASLEPGSLMVYHGTSGTDKMFCVSANKLWDVSAGGFVATPAIPGLGNSVMSCANVNGRLVWANGVDPPQSYDGSTWSAEPLSVASDESRPLSTETLAAMLPFKNRVLWWKDNELGFWYSTLNTIGDALRYFDLSYVAREGGDLITITRYTVDGGSGPDDYPVFITSEGEALIYQGTNPNDASAWAFVGSFRIGKPPQHTSYAQRTRIAAQWGAQTYVITDNDIAVLPQALMKDGAQEPSMLSGAIQNAMNAYRDEPGWQALFYQAGPWLLFNIPTNDTDPPTYDQYIVDLHTQAASKLTGMNGRCWAVFEDDLYYATQTNAPTGPNKIYRALATATYVSIEIMPGASNLGSSHPKSFNGIRIWASVSASGTNVPSTANATVILKSDYVVQINKNPGVLRYNEWVLEKGVGTFVQIHISGQVTPDVTYKHFDYLYEDVDELVGYRDYTSF